MSYFQKYGSVKPGGPIQLDLEHPFGNSLIVSILFNEGFGAPNVISNGKVDKFVQLAGPALTWTSTLDGFAQRMGTSDNWALKLGTSSSSDWLPTSEITICIIRRKYDATLRNVGLCGCNNFDAHECVIYCPTSSNTAFWGFGGNSSPNALTSGTLSISTILPERWIFHAGPRGSAIWQNGIKIASQSTAISRTNGANVFEVNGPQGQDTNDWQYLSIYSTQWSDNLCQWWSASPYENLYYDTFGTKYFFLGALSSDVTGTLTETIPLVGLTGVGSYQDNQPNTRIQPKGNMTIPVRSYTRF